MDTAKIVHLASMARSGETMMLNVLSRHPSIRVAGQLDDSVIGDRRLRFFSTWSEQEIDVNHSSIKDLNLEAEQAILVKQGVWEHPWPFHGFVLARNPISIFASLSRYDNPAVRFSENLAHLCGLHSFKTRFGGNFDRFSRWFPRVDSSLSEHARLTNFTETFCAFYNRRMLRLVSSGLPIIHYEKFVENPESFLGIFSEVFGFDFDSSIFESTSKGVGHGKNDLGRSIDRSSLSKLEALSDKNISRVVALTFPAWDALGYQLKGSELVLC